MNSSCPGSFVLSGRAFVQNPRPVPSKPRTVVLDVSFLAPPDRETAEFACSLRYFKGEEGLVIADGLYDVVATVVAFRPDVNVPSTIISEHQFKLMGDISELKPIPITTDEVIEFSKKPAVVNINGCVASIDDDADSFSLALSQYVTGATQHETMHVRAFMNRNTPFSPPSFHLPRINSLVGFTAKLDTIESYTEIGSRATIRAVVIVESISHLTGDEVAPMSNEDADTVALKTRVRKYTVPTESEGNEVRSSEKECSGGSSKGKRKLTLTFDGGAGGKERSDKKRK